MTEKKVDPILVAVIENALNSVCQQMGETMLRTSRSPIFAEARDFVTAIYDRHLRLVAEQEYIPSLVAATPPAMKKLVEKFEGDIHPGDVFISNDPYEGECNHPPDIQITRPVFWKGEIVFWTLAKGHQADTGGAGVCGYNPKARDCWEDAIRIPISKVYEKGVYNRDLWDMILLNLHVPFLVEGDLHCEVGATKIGENHLIDLMERYGLDVLDEAIDQYLDANEKLIREGIRKIPDGVYYGEESVDDDGYGSMKTVRVKMEVKDDDITFDFSDSDPQSEGPFNSTLSNTISMTCCCFFATLGPVPRHNEGAMRPIKVVTKEGTVAHCVFPAACVMVGPTMGEVIGHAVWRAVAQAAPEISTAGWSRFIGISTEGHNPRTDKMVATIDFFGKGGIGATHGYDGWDHCTPVTPLGNCQAPDPELHEMNFPFTILNYEINQDSGAPGQWRGGLGVHYTFRVEADNLRWSNWSSGARPEVVPYGVAGGMSAKPNSVRFIRKDGTVEDVPTADFSKVNKGDICEIFSTGGGGYGDPHLRPAEVVLKDVINEVVSIRSAKEDYGVAIDPQTLAINWDETNKIRNGKA